MASHLCVIGAGPAGLVAALAGRRLGFTVSLFDQAHDFGAAQGCWLLQQNGCQVLRQLDLHQAFPSRPIPGLRLESASGRLLYSLELPECRVVVRSELQQALLQQARVEGVAVHLGQALTGYRPGLLEFPDGSVRADLVLGADGVDSRLRRALGVRAWSWPGPRYLRAVVDRPCPWDCSVERWGSDGRRFGIDPAPGGRTGIYCTAGASDWHEYGVADLVEAVGDWGACKQTRRVFAWPWSRPPAFLLGDAAHAQAPTLGQGANAAMVDALLLVQLLARRDPVSAGREFERRRRGYVTLTQLVGIGLEQTSQLPLGGVRDAVVGLMHRSGWLRGWAGGLVAGSCPP